MLGHLALIQNPLFLVIRLFLECVALWNYRVAQKKNHGKGRGGFFRLTCILVD